MKIFIAVFAVALVVLLSGCGGQWHLDKGAEALQKKQFDTAVTHLEKARQKLPDNAEVLNLYGAALKEKGDLDAAREALQASLKLAPEYASARFNLAAVEFDLGNYQQVIAALKPFADAPPENAPQAEAFALLGDAYLRVGNNPEAIRAYAKLGNEKLRGNRAEISNKLGVINTRLGKARDAENWFKISLQQNPQFAPANLNLGRLYHFYLPNKAAARPYYQKFLDLTPSGTDHEQAQTLLNTLESELKPATSTSQLQSPPATTAASAPPVTTTPSVATTEPAVGSTVPPANTPIETAAVVTPSTTAAVKTPEPPKPEAVHKPRLVAGDRKKAEQLYSNGFAYHQRKDYDKAISFYLQATTADPTFANAHYNLATIYQTRNQTDKAITSYQTAVEAKPNFPEAHTILATLLLRSGKKNEAIVHLEKVCELQPDDAALAHAQLGQLYAELGKTTDARTHYQRFIELRPDDPQVPAIKKWLKAAR